MLHVISARCVARDLHTIAPGPHEPACWRQFAVPLGDCKKSRRAPLNAIILYYIILYYIILYYIILYYIILYYIILYYIISYYIILYHIILYYILYLISGVDLRRLL